MELFVEMVNGILINWSSGEAVFEEWKKDTDCLSCPHLFIKFRRPYSQHLELSLQHLINPAFSFTYASESEN